MQESGKMVRNFSKACGADAKTNCAGVKPGQGRILACLKQHEATLSADCKKLVTSKTK